jgi:Cof subfamily protein (haloacid dehalogenase superfamily)
MMPSLFLGYDGSMSIKLIALDLDGTIVNEHLEISPKTVETIQTVLRDTDVRVVIATGRMYSSSLSFANTLGIQDPIVAYQGALIRHHATHRDIIEHTTIPLDLARPVLQKLMDEEYHVNLYHCNDEIDKLFTNSTNIHATYYSKISGVVPTVQDCLMDALTCEPTKFLVIDDHRIDTLLAQLQEEYDGQLSVCKSRPNFCEIINVSASKWNALMTLAGQWGITAEEIMAIGDHGNDYSMISQAGLGVAMGNAPSEIQSVAKYVTAPIAEDGVAQAIEKFVLNNDPLPTGGAVEFYRP